MDKIFLKDCQFYGYHGALAAEQKLGQLFHVDCELTLDLSSAIKSDQLKDTLDYGEVFSLIKKHMENTVCQLLEALAGNIINELFATFPRIQTICLSISKENPPIAGHYQAIGITLERTR